MDFGTGFFFKKTVSVTRFIILILKSAVQILIETWGRADYLIRFI